MSLLEALGINDRGQITGFMLDISSGEVRGFLATSIERDKSTGLSRKPAAARL